MKEFPKCCDSDMGRSMLQYVHNRRGLMINKPYMAYMLGVTFNVIKWQFAQLIKYNLIKQVGWGEYVLTEKGLKFIN